MSIAVNLNTNLVNSAKARCIVENCSVSEQIEYWVKIGRIVQENPDLSYNVLKVILLGLEDLKTNNIEEYNSGSL